MKKKKLLLILPISFFLCSCNLADVGIGQFKPFSSEFWQGLSIFGWQPFGGKDNKDDSKNDSTPIEDVDIDENKHATSISADPSAAFYLKKGESRNVKVTLSPSTGVRDEEKTFTWSITKGDGVTIPSGVTGNTIEITAVKASTGNVVTAVNDYNHSLTKSFTIHVIDFDEENDYLWQYASEDKNQFGYTSSNKQGDASGTATLNGISWSFLREPEAISINTTQSGAIGFGKGENPETHVHFEAEVGRTVESITFEVASANSLAKMSVSVGETAYMTEKTVPKVTNNALNFITTDEVSTPVSGKIQIDVVTPQMDDSRKEDPDYNAPGAFYIKSILIHFGDTIETVTEETFNFKDMYDNRADGDGIFGDLTKTTAKQIQFSQNDFDVTLEKVKKEATENIPDYAHTNGYIEVKLNKPGEEIFKVEFKIEYGTTSDSYKTLYGLYVSKSGGAPFKSLDISSDKTTCMLNASLFESNHINAIRLVPSKTNNIGLDYLKISTKAGINPTISSITPPAEFVPSVKEYSSGELFDTTGLGDLTISYEESGVEPDLLPASELEWFDGVSYDADPATATKELQAGTSYVYGIFRGEKVAKITGLTVVDIPISLTIVKNISDINTTDHYFIIEKDSKTLIKGSAAGDMGNKSKSGTVTLDLSSVGDSISIPGLYKNDYYTFTESGGLYSIGSTSGNHFGMTNSGNLSTAKSPQNPNASLTIDADSGATLIKYEKSSDTSVYGYLYLSGGTIVLNTTATANLCFYKVN